MKRVFFIILLISITISSSFGRDIPNEQKIAGLYVAFFNRAPDLSGLNYWKGRTALAESQGKSPMDVFEEISLGFSSHPVFVSTYSSLSNEEFVKAIYLNTLGGEGDAEGISYWTDQLNNNMSRSDMVAIFIDSSLTLDLTPENFPSLSQTDLDAAKARQDLITNKTEVALAFVDQLLDRTNVTNLNDVESDPAYKASIKILSGITTDSSSVTESIELLKSLADDPKAIDIILNEFTPVGSINSCIVNITYLDTLQVVSSCVENYPKEDCPYFTNEESDYKSYSFMEEGDCAALHFPLERPQELNIDSKIYTYYQKEGAFVSQNSEPTFIEWENNATTVTSTIELPQNSPFSMTDLSVDVVFHSYTPDADGNVMIKFPKDKITDATIAIQNPTTGEYMIYLESILLPGETTTSFSATETALSLVLNGIDHNYLTKAGTAQEVKDTIRQNSSAFIAEFAQNLQNDPYYMRIENLPNIYESASFKEALANSSDALAQMYDANQLPVAQNQITSDGLTILPQEEIQDFKILADRESGDMTGNLVIENDTMLPARYKTVDLFTKRAIHIPNNGIFGDLISPQSTILYGYNASQTQIKTDFRTSKVAIYTPGWAYLSSDTPDYDYIKNMNYVLSERLLLDNVVMTLLTSIPVGDEQVFYQVAQWIINQSVFRTALDEYYAAPGKASFLNAVTNIVKNMMTWDNLKAIVEIVAKHYAKDPEHLAEVEAKWAQKLASASVGVWIYAADFTKLAKDLMQTSPYIEFTEVTFPTFLKYYDPAYPDKMMKVSSITDTRTVMLTGENLYEDGAYPIIKLEALDKDGNYQSRTLTGEDIHKESTGVSFELPYLWLENTSDIVGPIYFQYQTSFTDKVTNKSVRVNIPASFRDEAYKIFLTNDVTITSLSEDKIIHGQELTIYGKGFAEYNNDKNKVYLLDGNSNITTLHPNDSYSDQLKIVIPDSLAFGETTIWVKVNDSYQSNSKAVTLIPKLVHADPSTPTDEFSFKDSLSVTLSQPEGVDIFYSLDTSDKTNAKPYTGPIYLTKTTTIYPFARAYNSFHMPYDSMVMEYHYYKCADDEELVDGECVKGGNNEPDTNQHCPSTSTESSFFINIADKDNDGYFEDYIKCWYYDSGQLGVERPYINNELNGIYKEYYESGQLREEVPYIDNKINGIYKYYYESGQIRFEIQYTDDKINGIYKEYYESGQLEEETPYIDGKEDGISKSYCLSGKLSCEIVYENGTLISRQCYDCDDE